MEFRDHAAKETSALVARLFAESAENSRQRLTAFRTAINNATKALETAIGAAPNFEREVGDLVTRLAKAASAEAEAATERTAAEARVAADALRAELKAESKQKESLAASLTEARAKTDALQSELDAEKQRSETARREVTDAREALKKVEAARVEAIAERDKEATARETLETELHRLHEAADALRAEASNTSDQLEVAIAEKARLEEALAAAQSQAEATAAKLASMTTLFQQTSTKLKALERDHQNAMQTLEASHSVSIREIEANHAAKIRELDANYSVNLRELEASHGAALRDMEASRHAAVDEALREAERDHEAAIRDLEAVHAAALRELEAKHAVEIHELEAEHAASERDSESRHSAAVRDLEAQLHASSSVGHAAAHESVVSRVDELLDGFHALSGASSVGDVLATMVEHLAAQFSRVALFYVRGNRLEGSNQIGFEFDHDIAKLVFPLGMDSLLTRAVVSGRIEHVTGDELADSGLAPFGGAPTCALALPVVVQGETLAIVYADDSGRSAGELSTRFASALLQHAVALLMRLNNQLRHLAELRDYATSLLSELQETYDADVASGKSGEDLLHRLQNNLDFARSIYATRIESEGPDAAPLFEEQLAALMDEHAESRFGRDLLAIVGRGEVGRKAEAS